MKMVEVVTPDDLRAVLTDVLGDLLPKVMNGMATKADIDRVERLIKDTRDEVADVAASVKALAEGSPSPGL